ncbi:unnamed protein product, partial [marine sediment metagenome]
AKGMALGELEKYEEAIVCHDKILELDPNDIKAWYDKGFVLNMLEMHEEAIKCHEKALELDPEYLEA